MKKNTQPPSKRVAQPLMRLRHLLGGVAVVALVIAGPLLAVTRQVYLRSASISKEMIADSLRAENRQISRLRLQAERLSENHRIEMIARKHLGLEYAGFEQITVLRHEPEPKQGLLDSWEFFAMLKRSFSKERG